MINYGRVGIKKRNKALKSFSARVGNFLGVLVFDFVIFMVCLCGACGVSGAAGIFMGVIASAPDITNVDVTPAGYSTNVYDRNGKQLTKLVAENSNRVYVTMDKIPEDLQHAFVAIEDERFYSHNGIDLQGIMRAGVTAVTSGDLSQGASTITQQLLKNNVFLSWTDESSTMDKFKRKFQEQYCAVQLEKIMDKEKILENYLNTINLGQGTLGVQAASQRYFGKPCSQLTLSEDAVIACITQNPSKWNPISHPENNAIRREEVLRKMRDQGYITSSQYDEAMADDVYSRIQKVNAETETNTIYTYFVDELVNQVMDDLQNELDYSSAQAYNTLYSGGLSIFTTQDPDIQKICDEEMNNPENYPENVKYFLKYALTFTDSKGENVNFSTYNFESYFKEKRSKSFNCIYKTEEDAYADIEEFKEAKKEPGYTFASESISLTPQPQTSITIMDQYSGEVVALVGGRGSKKASLTLNRATDTTRQPGSCFKVLAAYAPALETGKYTLASTQVDEPYEYANGRPVKNWYDGYKGVCTYRYGIEQSLNIIAVKALTAITPRAGYDKLLEFGFTTLVDKRTEWNDTVSSDITQSLALGGLTDGVTNMELTAAYAAIANDGKYNKPKLYTKIVDHDGNILIDHTETKERQVLKATNAYCLTSAMQDVVTKGTGAKVNFGNMAIAGKTGTTTSNVDVWFCGYTPYYTAATWCGYDNNVHMVAGETNTAKYMWKAIMGRVHKELPYKDFTKPEGVVSATVCSNTGLKPNTFCATRTDIMDKDSVPTEVCSGHIGSELGDGGATVLGTMCSQTGKMATDTCPYKTAGMVNPAGGYCIHSYLNGIPLFTTTDIANQTENAQALQEAANQQAAAAAAAAAAQAAAEAAAAQQVPAPDPNAPTQ